MRRRPRARRARPPAPLRAALGSQRQALAGLCRCAAALTLAAAAGLPLTASIAAAANTAPLIAVSANMAGAAAAIAERFERENGRRVRLSVGASGNLARQILRGAPFELFISADAAYPRRIHEAGLTAAAPRHYATGRLELVLRGVLRDDGHESGAPARSAREALENPRLERLAIANPEHAPYGRAARQVLETLGLWTAFEGRLVIGENAAQTARFATTGAVQAALLPRAIAMQPLFSDSERIAVPDAWHDPIEQHMVLLAVAGPVARGLHDFMLGGAAREILARLGYELPVAD